MVPSGFFLRAACSLLSYKKKGDVADKDTILKGFLLSSHVNIKYLK